MFRTVLQLLVITLIGLNCSRDGTSALESLKSEDSIVREKAVRNLGESKREGARDALIRVMHEDRDESVRRAAVLAIGELGDTRAIPALVATAAGNDVRRVRSTAVLILQSLDDPAIVPGLISLWALDATAPNGDNAYIQGGADLVIGGMGARAYEPLVRALTDPSWNVRYFSVGRLATIGDTRARGQIALLLEDPDERVRAAAKRALAELR